MRETVRGQMKIGEVDISKIEFNPKERDEIPQLLRGLQHIYCDPELRRRVFAILERALGGKTAGRPGMELWSILVLGTLRLNCGWNYDTLKSIVDNHWQIRMMLGWPDWPAREPVPLQTLKDNVELLTPELLEEISGAAAGAGQTLIKKNSAELCGKCDSFVLKTNVHHPTDISLLFDAARKCAELAAELCGRRGVPGWRQAASLVAKLKKKLRLCEKLKRSAARGAERTAKEAELKEAHGAYTENALALAERAEASAAEAASASGGDLAALASAEQVSVFAADARRQAEQIERRVLKGGTIPHGEKVFSIFERHTEWICKGKAEVPQELGARVGIVTDQHGFILSHMVMGKTLDTGAAAGLVSRAKERFPGLESCSFDKGFWSPENLEELKKIIPVPALPKRGRLSAEDRGREESETFRRARKGHPAVESSISALENHGLGRCPDRGIKGLRRYAALAVAARNIQILGAALLRREKKKEERSKRIKEGLERRREAARAA